MTGPARVRGMPTESRIEAGTLGITLAHTRAAFVAGNACTTGVALSGAALVLPEPPCATLRFPVHDDARRPSRRRPAQDQRRDLRAAGLQVETGPVNLHRRA